MMTALRSRTRISPDALTWLFEVATGAYSDSLSAFSALEFIYTSASKALPPFPFVAVTKFLERMSPSEDCIQKLRLQVSHANKTILGTADRETAIKTFVMLLEVLGRSRALQTGDVPTCIQLLVGIGMDPSTSFNLRLRIKSSINTLLVTFLPNFENQRSQLVSRALS